MSKGLTSQQVEHIKAGVPLMEQAGDAFLSEFYAKMISENPALLNVFNKTHQRTLDQPRALTRAVVAYAKNIDNLGVLSPVVERIVQKHCSLNVKAEHYPIVGKYLLDAISVKFGPDVATPAFLDAWAAAYGQLAELLIGAEKGVYEANRDKVGGWEGYRQFKVSEKVDETENVSSFKLVPVDGKKTIVPLPGQYLGFSFNIPALDEHTFCRQYSISDYVEPLADGAEGYRISVKKIPGGAISNNWHEHIKVGDTVDVSPPCGEFVLKNHSKPVLLVTAGIGVTPAISLSKHALASGQKVGLIQCDHKQDTVPFNEYFSSVAKENPDNFQYKRYLSGEGKRLDKNEFLNILETPNLKNADIYVIGPKDFMRDVRGWIHSSQKDGDHAVYYDFFGPAQWDE
ncbi:Yhb1p [Sugiyamaella lignohabitans]|uniref:nitric oxide dioxygenase n=1 Tax=Sugiyamaella lignohabitans TaxID=796027 RepID=A0A167EK10_9ASCO|nr:Yhb1p [Sugiyamaella lignohabitans]ANB14166.1 Yhb1p [Sugiyamaella lignohabitans]